MDLYGMAMTAILQLSFSLDCSCGRLRAALSRARDKLGNRRQPSPVHDDPPLGGSGPEAAGRAPATADQAAPFTDTRQAAE
jgi:hypothetical protein